MDAASAAAKLDGKQYGDEGSSTLFAEMKEHGLVAVFGASDDLMEFRGAVYDEVGVDSKQIAETFDAIQSVMREEYGD